MDTRVRFREKCHGCSKNILKHNRLAFCKSCQQICHAKCAEKLYSYDHIQGSWSCWECCSTDETKYNPFKSFKYDKYSQSDTDSFNEIHQIDNLLDNCKRYSYTEINNLIENSSSPLSVMFKNIDGVASNFDMFSGELFAAVNKLSVLTLAETNLDECNKNLFNIQGYQSVYQSKIAGKLKGSGLAIYIKDSFLYTLKEDCNQCSPNLESLFVTITNTDSPITVGVIYKPPSGDKTRFLSELHSLMQKLPKSNVYLSGDFNSDLHKRDSSDFEDIVYGNGYAPVISIATHFKPGCNPSCIDNVLTNSTDTIISSGVCKTKVTHHFPIFCLTSAKWKSCDGSTPNLPKYDFSESNMLNFENDFFNYLASNDFLVDDFSASEEKFENLISNMSELIDECFLMDESAQSSKRNRIVNPWISSGIIASINKKDFLYGKWRKSIKELKSEDGDPELYSIFKEFRKLLKGIISHAKTMHKFKKFEKAQGDSRDTWKVINEIRGKTKGKIKPSFIIDGTIVEERRLIANGFNKYFASIAVKLNSSEYGLPIQPLPNFTNYMSRSVDSSIFLSECTCEEIEELIKDLSSNKSSDIPIVILKRCKSFISPVLTRFYNEFMRTGIFPDILKTGLISPIYKKGNPQLFDNYRPVSTLPLFSKLLEKLIYKRLYDFLVTKNILYDKQFGFRKNHSTSQAINYSVKFVSDNIEQRKHVVGIFLDLSKAFDTISHSKLLDKLQNYGIRGNCLELLRNYLGSRKQITKFDSIKSELENVQYGVPQGSVLGPLLFLIYINDIVNATTLGHFVIFADDTNIFVSANSKAEAYKIANNVLRFVYLYMLTNQLHINLSKCAHMYFRHNLNNDERMSCARSQQYDSELTLSVNGQKVKRVDKIKFLGVIIDEKLSWNDHIEYLENKLLSTIVLIKRVKKFIPQSLYLDIYHSLFISHLTYGISCWGGTYSTKLEKLFNIQKRCVRILFGETASFDHPEFYATCARSRTYQEHVASKDYSLEHTKPLFNKHGLLTLHNLYALRCLVELIKLIKSHCPISMFSYFSFCPKTHHYQLLIPKFNLDISKNNFVVSASSLWNACIENLLDKPVLSSINSQISLKFISQIIIPGSNSNSDMTIPIGIFKNRLKDLLLKTQKLGNSLEWVDDVNFVRP